MHTGELRVTVTNYWDNLQRLTGQKFWDETTSSNIYSKRDGPFANSTGGTNLLDLTGSKDRLGNWSYFNRDAMRRVVAFVNGRGLTNLYSYCSCGSLESMEYPTTAQVTFEYDFLGRLTNWLDFGVSLRRYQYDALGRLLTETEGLGTRTHTYDNRGLLVGSANANGTLLSVAYDVLGRPTNVVDARGVIATNSYDSVGRLLTRTLPQAGAVGQFSYAANVAGPASYTDPLGKVTTFGYDLLSRLTNQVLAGVSTNRFSYNPAGSLAKFTNGNGFVTSWSYDQEGRLYQKTDPAAATTTFTYFPTGWLSNRLDSVSHATEYDYDGVGNLLKVRYLHQGTTNSYTYDGENRVSSMSDSLGVTDFNYAYCGPFSLLGNEISPWPNAQRYTWIHGNTDLYAGYGLTLPNAPFALLEVWCRQSK